MQIDQRTVEIIDNELVMFYEHCLFIFKEKNKDDLDIIIHNHSLGLIDNLIDEKMVKSDMRDKLFDYTYNRMYDVFDMERI